MFFGFLLFMQDLGRERWETDSADQSIVSKVRQETKGCTIHIPGKTHLVGVCQDPGQEGTREKAFFVMLESGILVKDGNSDDG